MKQKCCRPWGAVIPHLSWGVRVVFFRVVWCDSMHRTKCTHTVCVQSQDCWEVMPSSGDKHWRIHFDSLLVWFWINCWSLCVQKPFYCYQISHDPPHSVTQSCARPQPTIKKLESVPRPRLWSCAGLVSASLSLTRASTVSRMLRTLWWLSVCPWACYLRVQRIIWEWGWTLSHRVWLGSVKAAKVCLAWCLP